MGRQAPWIAPIGHFTPAPGIPELWLADARGKRFGSRSWRWRKGGTFRWRLTPRGDSVSPARSQFRVGAIQHAVGDVVIWAGEALYPCKILQASLTLALNSSTSRSCSSRRS
jgi:hypothetical protein